MRVDTPIGSKLLATLMSRWLSRSAEYAPMYGAMKMTDVKMHDMKLTDQFARHEIAGHFDGPLFSCQLFSVNPDRQQLFNSDRDRLRYIGRRWPLSHCVTRMFIWQRSIYFCNRVRCTFKILIAHRQNWLQPDPFAIAGFLVYKKLCENCSLKTRQLDASTNAVHCRGCACAVQDI